MDDRTEQTTLLDPFSDVGDDVVRLAVGTSAVPRLDDAELLIGSTINDRYHVTSLIGSGGMASVYLAVDASLDRHVALKLHRAGTGTRASNDRLHREAVAMAKLAHPNVVNVFEVGSAADRLYVAMEYVPGGTLRTWLAAAPRSRPQIIALLLEAGAGLAAAHAIGLVHRDFKPENVLVGVDGRPRVSDFGLARLGPASSSGVTRIAPLASAASASALEVTPSGSLLDSPMTLTGTVLGTPAYMAPEQFDGHVDARSDQFAYCVVMWECLFGQRPFAGSSLAEIQAAVLAGELRMPRRSQVPRRLRRVLERGLRADASARHPDMAALLGELRLAMAPRTRRWIAWSAAASVLVASGAIAAGVALHAHDREAGCTSDGDRIRTIYDASAQTRVREAFARVGGAAVFARIDPVLQRYTATLGDEARAACLRDDEPPQLAAARRACLADRTVELSGMVDVFGRADAALVRRAPEAAWALLVPAPCDEPPIGSASSTRTPEQVAQLGRVRAAFHAGRYTEGVALAEPVLRDARARGDRLGELAALELLAQLRAHLDKPEDAATLFHHAIALAETLGRDLEAAGALYLLANIAGVDRHDYVTAHRYLDLARAKLERVGGGNVATRADLRLTEGQVLADEGKYADAELAVREAIDLGERAYGPDHPRVGAALGTFAQVLMAEAKYPEALAAAQRATEIFTRSLGTDHVETGGAQMTLAQALISANRLDDARPWLERADAAFAAALGPNHPTRAAVAGNLGELERELHHYDAALVAVRRAIAILEKASGPDTAEVAGAHRDLARTLAAAGKYSEALVASQRDVAILEKLGGDNPRLASAELELAEIQLALHHPAVAAPIGERALALLGKQGSDADPVELAAARFVVARALVDTGGDRTRAHALAVEARKGADPDQKPAIDAWLAVH